MVAAAFRALVGFAAGSNAGSAMTAFALRGARFDREVSSAAATSTLEPFLPVLDDAWTGGCRNGAELWRQLQACGVGGSLRVVTEWATRRRRAEQVNHQGMQKIPSARMIAHLMTTGRHHLGKAATMTVAAIEAGVPDLNAARKLIMRFHHMVRTKAAASLDAWIAAVQESLLHPFARGILKDREAVLAAIREPWSNGQTEGQVNRLKLVKRQPDVRTRQTRSPRSPPHRRRLTPR